MPTDTENLEVDLLLEALYRQYGYDFRDYARASVRRRLRGFLKKEKLASVSELQAKVLHDPQCWGRLLVALSVNVTSMFRCPAFWLAFRQKVVPFLRTYPSVRLWCAGCSTGEEVYSLAILLDEEGLLDRARIYATDLNEAVLETAKAGVFPLAAMKEYTDNYQQAGGNRAFGDYYTAKYDHARFRPELRRTVVFAQHNLVTDTSFQEFQAILCRNVLIYFNKDLQDRVHRLLFDSLAVLGALCLGEKETLKFSPHEQDYEALAESERVYRRRA
jgi:chemotaxis protein methyltransferase CheR